MEVIDNLVMIVIPGAMEAGLGTLLFWGALAFALAVAFTAAVPVNRRLIARGKGHAAVHRTGVHGGPSPRTVGVILAVAFVFGSTVLLTEALDNDADGHRPGGHALDERSRRPTAQRSALARRAAPQPPIPITA